MDIIDAIERAGGRPLHIGADRWDFNHLAIAGEGPAFLTGVDPAARADYSMPVSMPNERAGSCLMNGFGRL
jgi:hypothetical protein